MSRIRTPGFLKSFESLIVRPTTASIPVSLIQNSIREAQSPLRCLLVSSIILSISFPKISRHQLSLLPPELFPDLEACIFLDIALFKAKIRSNQLYSNSTFSRNFENALLQVGHTSRNHPWRHPHPRSPNRFTSDHRTRRNRHS